MNEFLLYFLLQTLIIFPSSLLLLRVIFKNMMLFKFAISVLPGVYFISITGFIVGKYGMAHILWSAPISTLIFVISFKYLLKIIQKPMTNLAEKLNNISKGKLNNNLDEDKKLLNRTDEIGLLYTSAYQIDENLKNIVKDINKTSSAVLNAGNQLSSMSLQIAQSANEQASTTEEVSSAMEEMLATVSSNTENAKITGKTTSKSTNRIKKSNDIFQKTVESVLNISERIIIISEIAKKTDLLSINASIEAARAGETGKGFAIVAQEIRKLADKTKIASVEIEKLSNDGQSISLIAGKNLEKAIPEIVNSAKLVDNIVAASHEQENGIQLINNSIQQLTKITNSNSASSEEMSTSSEELLAKAKQLKEIVAFFKIVD